VLTSYHHCLKIISYLFVHMQKFCVFLKLEVKEQWDVRLKLLRKNKQHVKEEVNSKTTVFECLAVTLIVLATHEQLGPYRCVLNDYASHYSGSRFFCYNLPAASATEVFKPSTDAESLLGSIKKNF